ncbi:hypothetical protein EYZ11_008834 [Aspergillus tanneri]|nr:hypothetical protein EYZ11_008834 [Aspergillus tanneri]
MPEGLNPDTGWHLRLSNGALTGHGICCASYSEAPNTQFKVTGDVSAWNTIGCLTTAPNKAFNIVTP